MTSYQLFVLALSLHKGAKEEEEDGGLSRYLEHAQQFQVYLIDVFPNGKNLGDELAFDDRLLPLLRGTKWHQVFLYTHANKHTS